MHFPRSISFEPEVGHSRAVNDNLYVELPEVALKRDVMLGEGLPIKPLTAH
jgi:hypothetical protein